MNESNGRRRPVIGWPQLGRGRLQGLPPRSYRLARRLDGVVLALLDAVIVHSAYLVALVIGFESDLALGGVERETGWWLYLFPALCAVVHLALNKKFGLYGPVWRYASVEEAIRIVGAVCLGTVTATGLLLVGRAVTGDVLPVLTAPPVAALIVMLGSGGIRFQSRLFALARREGEGLGQVRTLIVGAGDAGATLASESSRDSGHEMSVVGFLDADPKMVGRTLRRIPVLGTLDELADVCERHAVDRIVVAMPTASGGQIRSILDQARTTRAQIQVLPGLEEQMKGSLLESLRDIDVTDLLRRPEVHVDVDRVRHYIEGSVVLITGAGGSIGGEIARQVAKLSPRRLLLLDNDETHLHDLVNPGLLDADCILADIRDRQRLRAIFAEHSVDIVFHAAAHKHVPLLEQHPQEAVRTNVIGTLDVATAAAEAGCPRFILISTDKAASPASVMGATKRMAELVVEEVGRRHRLPYVAVRFGNVLGSRGSVVPTFLRQIAAGGPVTLTDPQATRYFMSISEAVTLVLQAGALSEKPGIFLLDMGEPINIEDLARQLIRMAGLRPGADVPIVVTGLRPGERLHEQLYDGAESLRPSGHPDILSLEPAARLTSDELRDAVDQLASFCSRGAGHAAASYLVQVLTRVGITCSLAIERPADISLRTVDGAVEAARR